MKEYQFPSMEEQGRANVEDHKKRALEAQENQRRRAEILSKLSPEDLAELKKIDRKKLDAHAYRNLYPDN